MVQLSRRQFITLAAAAAAPAARADLPPPAAPLGVSPAGAALYRKSFILDCNTFASIGEICCDKDTPRCSS